MSDCLKNLATFPLLLITSILLSGCPTSDNATGGSQDTQATAGKQVDTADTLTEADIARRWSELSDNERKLMQEQGMSLLSLQQIFGGRRPADLEKVLTDARALVVNMDRHMPGVFVGNAVDWRELYRFSGEYADSAILMPGNFDPDPEWEMLLVARDDSRLMQADGGSEPTGLPGWGGMQTLTAWDHDANGVMELVTASYSPDPSQGLTIVNLEGKVLGRLNGRPLIAMRHTLDMDGDGQRDFLLDESGGTRVVVLSAGNREIWSTERIMPAIAWAIGDFDGDGSDDLLSGASGSRGLSIFSLKHGEQELPFSRAEDQIPCLAADLDGDGIAELLSQTAILAPDASLIAPLELPQGWTSLHFGAFPSKLGSLRLADRTVFVARVTESKASNRSDTLLAWDISGRLVYQEHFAADIDSLYVLPGGDVDSLIVRSTDGIYAGEIVVDAEAESGDL